MPAVPNFSYCQDFRPFTPFRVTVIEDKDVSVRALSQLINS